MPSQKKNKRYQQLREQQLFEGVSLDAIEHYFDSFTEQYAPADTVILELDQENHSLYLLLEGEAKLHLESPSHPSLHALKPGECFGEMSLIDEGKTSAYVVADSDCHYLIVNEEALWGMVDASHGVARNLLFILTRRLRSDNETISASQSQMRRWENFALSDSLTGLNNRRWLDATIKRVVERSKGEPGSLSVIMLDVDHFKDFNDKWGHQAGDQALRTLAQVIRTQLRPTDLVARYGGEEFIILLTSTTADNAMVIANRLRTVIAATPCGILNDISLPAVTVSMGLTTMSNEQSNSCNLISTADQALYEAKQAGRNCVITLN
ncbi:diguanylate cyclase [Pseudomonadota bacterium]